MHTRTHSNNLPAAQSPLKDLGAALGTAFSAASFLTAFPTLAFHMMITFYLVLIIAAIMAGQQGTSPSLMSFVLMWHFVAVPFWILRSLTIKACKTALGMFICFVVMAVLFFILQPHLIMAAINIKNWINAALFEIALYK